jgi:hypothetical protein
MVSASAIDDILDCGILDLVDTLGHCFLHHCSDRPISDKEKIGGCVNGVIIHGPMLDD